MGDARGIGIRSGSIQKNGEIVAQSFLGVLFLDLISMPGTQGALLVSQ